MKIKLYKGFHPSEIGDQILILNNKEIKGYYVKGYLVVAENLSTYEENETYFIFEEPIFYGHGEFAGAYRVIPETVSEFTDFVKELYGEKLNNECGNN